jgi:hypothetical protein
MDVGLGREKTAREETFAGEGGGPRGLATHGWVSRVLGGASAVLFKTGTSPSGRLDDKPPSGAAVVLGGVELAFKAGDRAVAVTEWLLAVVRGTELRAELRAGSARARPTRRDGKWQRGTLSCPTVHCSRWSRSRLNANVGLVRKVSRTTRIFMHPGSAPPVETRQSGRERSTSASEQVRWGRVRLASARQSSLRRRASHGARPIPVVGGGTGSCKGDEREGWQRAEAV